MFSVTDRLASAKTCLRLQGDTLFLLYDISFYRERNAGKDGQGSAGAGMFAVYKIPACDALLHDANILIFADSEKCCESENCALCRALRKAALFSMA